MPLFQKKPDPDPEGYYPTVPADTIQQDRITAVQVDGRPLILTRVDGVIHAVSARCPHAAADLTKGSLYRGRIECPDHGYRFDVRTGRTLWPEDEVCRLKRYAVKEEGGVVKVKL
jgi:3-phenylpropionate/trans-cinnamate dioxygenase ferredoxin component